MIFVNNIAKVVHTMTDRYYGAANKNIGDAFLLVWKFSSDENFENFDDYNYLKKIEIYSDLACICFLKIQTKINREITILSYQKNEKILSRIPNYKVRMGFGLHIGWAIEGAIGSEYKIDASYLSPNVNMASRLEAATKQYGVPILISSTLYDNFSKELKKYCRKIDVVTVKGSNNPIGLYTIYGKFDDLPLSKEKILEEDKENNINNFKKQNIGLMIDQGDFNFDIYVKENKDLKLTLGNFDESYYQIFNCAIELYIEGMWILAKEKFLDFLKLCPSDKPSEVILNFMSENYYICPITWEGYRPLTDK